METTAHVEKVNQPAEAFTQRGRDRILCADRWSELPNFLFAYKCATSVGYLQSPSPPPFKHQREPAHVWESLFKNKLDISDNSSSHTSSVTHRLTHFDWKEYDTIVMKSCWILPFLDKISREATHPLCTSQSKCRVVYSRKEKLLQGPGWENVLLSSRVVCLRCRSAPSSPGTSVELQNPSVTHTQSHSPAGSEGNASPVALMDTRGEVNPNTENSDSTLNWTCRHRAAAIHHRVSCHSMVVAQMFSIFSHCRSFSLYVHIFTAKFPSRFS